MANNLFVSYRPNMAEQDYTQLINALESLGACIQVQEFFWYINSNKNVEIALEVLRNAIDPSDSLIVIDASNNDFEMNRNLREQVESQLRYVWD